MSLSHRSLLRACPTRTTANRRPYSVLTPASSTASRQCNSASASQSCRVLIKSHQPRRSGFALSTPVLQYRHASTSDPLATASSASPSAPERPNLSWNEFLRLRRIRRYFNLGGSLSMAVTGLFGGAGVVATEDIGGWGQQMFGLDPFVIMGLFTTGCAGLGWLMGPLVGTSVFGLFYRRFSSQMRTKERDFFERIKRYRVDPTSSSMQNPVPDYYGEKITSVAGYRRWLKDQRAFNKKRQSFV